MFSSHVHGARLVFLGLALAAGTICQSVAQDAGKVLSNKEARRLATSTQEATLPPGFNLAEFTVGITIGADGDVTGVSNVGSLPAPVFAAAKEAARNWHFPTLRGKGKPRGFQAGITFHGPLAGRITAMDGTPIADVEVSGSEWNCCPVKRDHVTTDKAGTFRIEHPGQVLHFFPKSAFQPMALVVSPGMTTAQVTLRNAGTSFSIASCGKLRRGFERVGWGNYGLQYDVPRHAVRLHRGGVDVDYLLDIVEAKHGHDQVEFWFGPYAMTLLPEDEEYLDSASFEIRRVILSRGLVRGSEGGMIGAETWGQMPDGQRWRWMAAGSEGARYLNVSPENAALFDRIINSACWIPDPVN